MSNPDSRVWTANPYGGGRPRLYADGEELRAAVQEYFDWIMENPLEEEVCSFYQGEATKDTVAKFRSPTLQGMAVFCGFSVSNWKKWKIAREYDLGPVIEWAESVIYDLKFTHAAAGLLNPNMISRDLGLSEKSELSGPGGKPLEQVVQYQLPSNGRDPLPEEPTEEA